MAVKIVFLRTEGCEVPVAVESSFTECDHLVSLGQAYDLIPVIRRCFGNVIRLDADRSGDHRVLAGQVHTLQTGLGGRAYGQKSAQTGTFCTCDHGITIRVKRLVIEMRVRIK